MRRPATTIPNGCSRPTNATMMAANPYPGDTVGRSCPSGPATSPTPARPAAPPPIRSATQTVRDSLKPA